MADWASIPTQNPIPGFYGKVQHSDSMSFVLWDIEKDAVLPRHRHMHEQVVHVLSGRFEMTVEDRTEVIEAGSMASIPSNAWHGGRALTNCHVLDAFSPVREDYRDGLTSGVISGATA